MTAEFRDSLGLKLDPTPQLKQFMRPAAELPQSGSAMKKAEKPQADVRVYDSYNQTTVFIDVRTCTMQHPQSKNEIGVSLKVGEDEKIAQYKAFYRFPEGVRFIPFAIDSHGRWNDAFKNYVRELCLLKAKGRVDDPVYAATLSRIRTRISIAHARAVGKRLAEGIEEALKNASSEVIQKYCVRGFQVQDEARVPSS